MNIATVGCERFAYFTQVSMVGFDLGGLRKKLKRMANALFGNYGNPLKRDFVLTFSRWTPVTNQSDVYKDDIEFVRNLIDNILEEKKERLEGFEKEKLEKLERKNWNRKGTSESATEIVEPDSLIDNLESLIKSVKTLTIPVPVRSESFNLFFYSLEKAFQNKSVLNELKAEILLNILGEKVNLLAYVSQEDLYDYEKIKQLVLKEFEPTPQECLNNFKKAQRLPSETYVQFASRLCASFDYYCQLRKVTDFRSLCDLIVSDRIFETLDRELMTHITIKQGESFFKPQQLGRECDVYLSSRGRSAKELINRNAVSEARRVVGNKWSTSNWRADKNISKIFVSETKNIKCVLCKRASHSLPACSQFRRLSVWDRAEVVKRNNLCFRCFSPHKLNECRSVKNLP
ncbi:hypothetical protein AVEN_13767-1 [Araneus ventricosus]|uniref:Uncharacterized protein n=1 Tax=Araneus ventricosus TaxID=182803 RepID=A0A4Y2MRQ5_ARAVE|nr:hypothetical protein AVEN_13767-1 [Araneus ventricosus]